MTQKTERLLQRELEIRRLTRLPGQFMIGIFVVLAGLIFAAGIYRVIASLLGFE